MNVLVAIYSPVDAWNIPGEHVQRLRARFPHHQFAHARTEAEVSALVGATQIAFMSELRPQHLAAAPNLHWVHSPAAGVGGMLFPGMIDSPVVISNSRGMSSDIIAEHVLALVLALFRKLPLALRSQVVHRWAQDEAMHAPPMRTVRDAKILIIGIGSIGAACAARFAALGAEVTGVRRRLDRPRPEGVSAVVDTDSWRERLPDADVVVIAAPQTTRTRRFFGASELAAMRRSAVVINVSRGKLLDEQALARSLADGQLAGAGLDVFEHEPLPPSSPLWDLPNAIITPHVASFREDHWDVATDLFAENLRRFDAGQPLLNVVDKAAGY